MGHFKNFAKGVVLGGIVGVVMGLFNAPKKGVELQKEARKKVDELIKRGKKLQKDLEPRIKKTAREAKKVQKTALKQSRKLVSKARKIAKKYKK